MMDELQERIVEKAHSSRYSIYTGSTKMYHDFREVYWWNSMKRYIADFVAKCPICQQVKMGGQAERMIQNLEDMLRACVMDFKGNRDDNFPLIEFLYNNSYHSSIQMAPYECHTPTLGHLVCVSELEIVTFTWCNIGEDVLVISARWDSHGGESSLTSIMSLFEHLKSNVNSSSAGDQKP
ncbi:hypothetical protein MTR67_019186 [Solanum verrucosum]|uniref:Integrase zinc-binding domain-containing protein n=1 Tax=Solanum verrucosum TaxID=315347 RepID=A0AAF0QM55_SOLVR|nr:hypothetical protein MTR67_019186 [Solanum verrucosum]